jgi:hypothetical protein
MSKRRHKPNAGELLDPMDLALMLDDSALPAETRATIEALLAHSVSFEAQATAVRSDDE